MNIVIRKEQEEDFRHVEDLTREAFWNKHVPGCNEHYLVHVMRDHADFIPELALVALVDGKIVGNIMYTRSRLLDENHQNLETITFGPISVLPGFQKKGIASRLIQASIAIAADLGYRIIVIQGHPHNYCKHGFVGSKSLRISDSEGRYPYSLLVLELERGCLQNRSWSYHPGDVYNVDEARSEEFDRSFQPKEKGWKPSQEEFNIAANAFVD